MKPAPPVTSRRSTMSIMAYRPLYPPTFARSPGLARYRSVGSPGGAEMGRSSSTELGTQHGEEGVLRQFTPDRARERACGRGNQRIRLELRYPLGTDLDSSHRRGFGHGREAPEPGDELGDDRVLICLRRLARSQLRRHSDVAASCTAGLPEPSERIVGALDDDARRAAKILLGRCGRGEPLELFQWTSARPARGPGAGIDGSSGDGFEVGEVDRGDNALPVHGLVSIGGEEVGEQTLLDAVRNVRRILQTLHRVGNRREWHDDADIVAEDLPQPTNAGVVVSPALAYQTPENGVEAVLEGFGHPVDVLRIVIEETDETFDHPS